MFYGFWLNDQSMSKRRFELCIEMRKHRNLKRRPNQCVIQIIPYSTIKPVQKPKIKSDNKT